jgi:hypothetical protein
MNHESTHKSYTAAAVAQLRARGIVRMPSSRAYLFCAAGNGSKVATAVHKGTLASVFTRGCLTLSDNFDCVEGRTKAVENCVFGPAKCLLEKLGASEFVSGRWSAERVLAKLDDFAGVEQLKLDALLADPALAGCYFNELKAAPHDTSVRKQFLARMMVRQFKSVDATVFFWAKKKEIGCEDPVVAYCTERKEALEAQHAALVESVADGTFSYEKVSRAYFAVREPLLDMLHSDPRFAKLAVGRKVIFPLVDDNWSGKNGKVELGLWAVAFARSAQLAQHPELAYVFGMAQVGGVHAETSGDCDIWAVQRKFEKGVLGPLQELLGAQSSIESDDAFWAAIDEKAPTRKLGLANGIALRRLTGSLTKEERSDEGDALIKLSECGWVTWFERNVTRLLEAEPLPEELRLALREAGDTEVREFWETLASELHVPTPASSRTSSEAV